MAQVGVNNKMFSCLYCGARSWMGVGGEGRKLELLHFPVQVGICVASSKAKIQVI